jgi:hypothetical protein
MKWKICGKKVVRPEGLELSTFLVRSKPREPESKVYLVRLALLSMAAAFPFSVVPNSVPRS